MKGAWPLANPSGKGWVCTPKGSAQSILKEQRVVGTQGEKIHHGEKFLSLTT